MKKVVVAGAGVLGSQIGFQSAYRGKDVTFWLRSEDSIERAKPRVETWYKTYLAELENMKQELEKDRPDYARGLVDNFQELTPEKIDTLLENVESAYANIKYETDLEKAVADAEIVIESMAEIKEEKHAFFQELAKYLPEETIVVSNSSTMLPSTFAEDTGRPEKYLHLHFANRIWRLNIGEVMVHPGTDEASRDAVMAFTEEIGMVPVLLNKERPGYILNSLLIPFLNAAQELLVTGVADYKDIDKTWKISLGVPMGPFEILDMIGLVTPYNLNKSYPQYEDPESNVRKIVDLYEKMLAEGKKGVETGEGFYKYDENRQKID